VINSFTSFFVLLINFHVFFWGTPIDSPDLHWEKIQECIVKSAEETLGMRTVDINASKKSTPWFTPEIKEVAHEKRKAYLRYISKPSIERQTEYEEVRNRVNSRIREIKEGYWERFAADCIVYVHNLSTVRHSILYPRYRELHVSHAQRT
jgi:hypothetical protein